MRNNTKSLKSNIAGKQNIACKLVSNRVIYFMTMFLYNVIHKSEILDSHCSVTENESIMGYYAISIGKR